MPARSVNELHNNQNNKSNQILINYKELIKKINNVCRTLKENKTYIIHCNFVSKSSNINDHYFMA